ncbi:MAG: Carotenoid biosynthesis protein [uncultured Thermomicrobiales bacterium]|uniref:Carotenoid biosynthesis protein n=1 Tax=uncultured Thermomicrobiales bacterium TaxID=1645740 RepID=A0A6J4ULZ1_9BACT|nr:MAG: Carotenoid biosynthesis protein [uncultured Thermomicrobiales bacterium]
MSTRVDFPDQSTHAAARTAGPAGRATRVRRVSAPGASWGLLGAHVMALVFGLGGLLIALPNPELWADSATGREVFDFGMTYAGSMHIIFGAAAVFALGVLALGWARTAVFFVLSTGISLGSELVGTGTGWPFGNYEYTDFLGYQVLGRVPFTIPLSWFYMGLACYLAGVSLARLIGPRWRVGTTALSIGLGVWFLVVWDMVLDPAMAHEDLMVQFWTWSETGPYFGMPAQNYIGWAATGLIYMVLSRIIWRRDPDPTTYPAAIPTLVYIANIIFASALSFSVGLWQPVVIAVTLALLPLLLALVERDADVVRSGGPLGRELVRR